MSSKAAEWAAVWDAARSGLGTIRKIEDGVVKVRRLVAIDAASESRVS